VAETAITVGQWSAVAGCPEYGAGGYPLGRRRWPPNAVRDYVNWCEAVWFCNELSKDYGFSPAYVLPDIEGDFGDFYYRKWADNCDDTFKVTWMTEVDGFRLPTSDEWLFAARAGQDHKYAGTDNWADVAEVYPKSYEYLIAKQHIPNAWGLFRMSGGALEWTWDLHRDSKEGMPQGIVQGTPVKQFLLGDENPGLVRWARMNLLGFRVFRSQVDCR